MVFLVDEFSPRDYDNIFFHQEIYDRLKKMSEDNSIPHIIFHGPCGSGKRIMTNIFLRMIYGNAVDDLYTTCYNIAGSGNKIKIENIQNSNHHIIINPTGTNFDRYLVHEVVKRYAGIKTLDLVQNPNSKFRTIQISNLDTLSHSAQTSLRRMIEVNASTCRFITWCNNLSNVIGPLRSRCVCIRIPRPLEGELFAYLTYMSIKKNFNPSGKSMVDIVKYSECDIKKAIWCLQLHILGYDYRTNYDVAIDNIIDMIIECNLSNMEKIRDMLFNIMITNYEGVKILRDIENKIIKLNILSDTCKINIIIKASEIEHNLIRGRRDIIHFDSFITQTMKLIQRDKLNKKVINHGVGGNRINKKTSVQKAMNALSFNNNN